MARNHNFRGASLQYISAPDSLNNLTDITISAAATLDMLQYADGKWRDVAAIKSLQIEDTSANHQYIVGVSELAADRTITLPLLTGNDIFVFNDFAAVLTNKTLTSPVLNTGVSGSAVLDEDNMATNSATQLATQQSIKAYVDAQVATEDTLAELNDTTISGPASNDVLQYSGSAWVDRTYAEAGIASLTGSETLSNKTLTSPTVNSPTISGGTATALTDLDMTSGNKTILDTIGSNTLTIGASGTTVTIAGNLTVSGTTTTVSSTQTVIADKLITLNDGGDSTSGGAVGIEVEENSSATGYIKTASDRNGWEIKAPNVAGVLTIDPSANSNTITFGGSGKTLTISETATINQDLSTTANVTHANVTATGVLDVQGNVTLGNAASDTVTVTGVIAGASPLVFEGGTANGYETTLAITDPTADRTWTLPNATDTFVGLATADSLSNKTLASPVITTGDINTPDIDGGTVDAITSLTIANNVDVGSYTIRASGFLADGLTAGQVVYTGTDGVLSSEAALAYNASTNTLTATNIAGTLTTAAQTAITSLGTLDALTVDSIALNGTTIGHTGDTDLLTLASGIVTVAGEVSMTTLDIGGTNVAATAAELNIIDGDTAASSTTVADADRVVYNDNGTMKQVAVTDLAAYFDDEITAMPNLVTTAATTVGVLASGSIASGFGAIDTGSSNITTTGTVSAGNLTVTGTTTTVNSSTMTVVDPIIHLQTASGGGALASDTNKDVGLAMQYHNGSAAKTAFLGFDDTDSKLTYIPDATLSSEVVSGSIGTIKANLEGTVQTAAQGSITSIGTLTGLTVSGEVTMTTLDIGGTNVTSTAGELNILDGVTATTAEINLVDGSVANTVVNSKAVIYGSSGQIAGPSLTSSGDLTLTAGSSTGDVLIGDSDGTIVYVDGGNATVGIGATGSSVTKFRVAGTYSGRRMMSINGTLTADNDQDIASLWIDNGITEAGSGTNAIISQARFDGVTIGSGGGATTTGATVYISAPMAGAVTNNYAFWVGGGLSRFDAGVVIGHTAQVTAGAASELQVLGTGSPDASLLIGRFSSDASGPTLRFVKSRHGTIGSNTIVADGDSLGEIFWKAADGGDFATTAASIRCEVDGTPGANDMPGALLFHTTPDGSDTKKERMVIRADGKTIVHVPTVDATSIDRPLIVMAEDSANAANLVAGSGTGIEFRIAGAHDSLQEGYAAYTAASIDAIRETAPDSESDASLSFKVSQNDTTLDEAMRITSTGKVGIGISSLESWATDYEVVQLGGGGSWMSGASGSAGNEFLNNNAYWDGSAWKYQHTDEAIQLWLRDGLFSVRTAASGSADAAITWETPFTTTSDGDIEMSRAAGGDNMSLLVENTTNSAVAANAFIHIRNGGTTSTGDPYLKLEVPSGNVMSIGIDNSQSDRFVISDDPSPGVNDRVRITTAGAITFDDSSGGDFTPDYVCDGCGKVSVAMFSCCGKVEWHDDVLAIRKMQLSPEGLQQMVKLGVYEVDGPDDSDPGWTGINYQKATHFTWAGMWQNRQRMDAQYEELNKRLEAIGA